MQLSPLKLTLIIVGSALGGIVVFIAAISVFISYRMTTPGGFSISGSSRERRVAVAPDPAEEKRFWGAHASSSGDFPPNRDTVLDGGPGKLTGVVTSNGKPVKGLRLRLMLNGSVMSRWATSDGDGRYAIDVPYGKYRIDGYELDSAAANAVLAGKTTNPRSANSTGLIVASEGKPGRALALDFVDPVRITGPIGEVSLVTPVVVTWDPYPGAAKYRLQLAEQKDPNSFGGQRFLFEWKDCPVVSGTSFDVAAHGIELKKGYFYSVRVDALDDNGAMIADSPRFMQHPDFSVAD